MKRVEHTTFWLRTVFGPYIVALAVRWQFGWIRLMVLVGMGQDSYVTYRAISLADMHELLNERILQRLSYAACLARKI